MYSGYKIFLNEKTNLRMDTLQKLISKQYFNTASFQYFLAISVKRATLNINITSS